jgi:hypothetical protein
MQFGGDALPVFGPPNGFGVMQLDNPAPTSRQIWDWTHNIDTGKALFLFAITTVRQHFRNLKVAHPTLPDLSDDQIRVASYQYYNVGNNGFYWLPSLGHIGENNIAKESV